MKRNEFKKIYENKFKLTKRQVNFLRKIFPDSHVADNCFFMVTNLNIERTYSIESFPDKTLSMLIEDGESIVEFRQIHMATNDKELIGE
jgi:hypothetical protein